MMQKMAEQSAYEQEMKLYNDELELQQIKQKKQTGWEEPMPSYGGSAPNIWSLPWNQWMNLKKTKLNRDPMKLHQLIWKCAFNYKDNHHLPDILHSVILLLSSLRQTNKMSNQEYYERFKAHYEIIKMAGGHIGQHPALIKMYTDDG